MTKNTKEAECSLENLMQKSQQGDKSAYGQLFYEITPILRSFISKKINRQEDVEDIVQEILISVHKAGHTYDTDRPFKAWMFAIARYRLNDHLRNVYKKREYGQDVNFDDVSYDLPNKENVTERYENQEYLSSLLEHLPEKQQKIVVMMKIEGYTAKETAAKLNMTESAVKVSAHRAYKALSLIAEKDM